ncbi:fungal-specific transcription factor domain-containing protein [Fusarium flagelliforme]|uniref:fungal-specific transcription factor domain-containing protein n=1 Tax=Fusarium flagelliforme TaxID=2675880 RepID=UPI001E8CE4DF|nr:fungal-specific transcription factor domain-containing protein [Fusarium flagelliforme]KAH7175085.1 fungal-specific transcription factor domain-containing protein [Fusarium flagelliforme]
MDTRQENDASAPVVKRRRNPRAVLACERCRSKKYKCSEAQPCSHCKRSGAECKYGRGYRVVNDQASLLSDASNEPGQPNLQVQPSELTHTPISQTPIPDLAGLQSPVSTRTRLLPTSISDETHALGASPSEESEIAEVNQHTNGIEYHGNTSSMSFLGSLQKLREQRAAPSNPAERKAFSLVSVLHNPSFVSRRNFTSDLTAALAANGFYSKRANTFIEGYFGGIHYVHPIIDKEDFLSRADQLWRGTDCSDAHFVALYLSVLSLGALTRTWNESTLDGLNRFQWSRKLFAEAQTILDEIQFSSKVETIQAFYVMAKVCQNELNPNLAYMYLGWAIRSCLATGMNRETPNANTKTCMSMSRIWWGIYSLEIEMSFLLGRPDTLGQDEYHNRVITPVDDSEYAIISSMVQFGRIMRKVSIGIYHSQLPTPETIGLACEIEREMDSWVDALPQRRGASLREPDWRRKQRLVLELRYHNVRMLLFRPFVTYYARERLQPSDELMAAVEKCISSAQKTIEIVYEAYKVHTYFRTWWYNTTYITIAASVLLLYESQTKQHSTTSTLALIETAIEILEVMDESIVARNAAEVIRRFVRELNTVPNGNSDDSMLDTTAMENVQQAPTPGPWNALDFGLTGFEFLNFPLGEMEAVFDELYKNLDHNAQLE